MELSKRLEAVASLVTKGMRLADVGTDHGYIPIFLVEKGVIPSAIAMDINDGPLMRAREHIQEHGLCSKIKTRKSDGLKELDVKETESMIAAGMGGALIIKILSDSPEVAASLKECILQPQSEIGKVRRFLIKNGFFIDEENMVYEDGKYYPMLRAIPGKKETQPYREEEYLFGRCLLEKKNQVLWSFLEREWAKKTRIREELFEIAEKPDRIRERIRNLEEEITILEKAKSAFSAKGTRE